MDEFPTSEDEFELTYGDDLDALRDLGDPEKTPRKSKRSLDFSQNYTNLTGISRDLFQSDVTPLEPQNNTENNDTGTPVESFQSHKRSVEELFGDIDDILYENKSKKAKCDEHSADLALIEHIVQLRRLAKEKDTPGLRRDYTTIADRNKDNLSITVPNYPFVGVTRDDGERVYVRCHSEDYEKEERQRIVNEVLQTGTSGVNQTLWEEAQEIVIKQSETQENICIDNNPDEKELWVDLYKPRKYFELLSDESTNRVMLQWIKLWDKVVFQRRPKIKPKQKDLKNKDFKSDLDETGRPVHKVALLCGPPGLGKTTLAHMVAQHAGYNVVEINASDDRSLEFFKKTIENATQMRSVLDKENRPNCLIFDEIDGAPAASIEYLVKYITGAPTKKKKKEKDTILKRPIICICNDVYVPALRPLRQIAFVVNFPPTSNTRLAERLAQIAKWQHVKTDMGVMLALAEKSQNDIRSCLSVLHVFKAQNKPVTLSDVIKNSVGQKDTQKGIFSVWQDIFIITKKNDTLKERAKKVLDVVNAYGDHEKVAQGVFENYVGLSYKSSDLEPTTEALEWFSFTDLVNKEIYSKQNYVLGTYLQYAFVVWHFAFGSKTWQKLKYPHSGYEAKMKQKRQKAIIGELLKGMQPSVRCYVQSTSLLLDIVPLLTHVISPSFRPISLHLYTEDEKKTLEKVVNVMIDYNLNYVQERTAEGTYVYKLDPAIDELVSFASAKPLSYSNKQLIAQEIETVKMRRTEAIQSRPQVPNYLQTLKAKSVSRPQPPSVVKDFFGRTISKKSSSDEHERAATRHDIWYQYKEGYNNAVRKRIQILSLK